MAKNFKFSIIIILNNKTNINESIDSIINQDIGFKDNVQLILVHNNALKESGEIASKYENAYPDNVVVVSSNAKDEYELYNSSFDYIEGEYFNFLNGLDRLSSNALKEVYSFFSSNKNEIDIVAIPTCKVAADGKEKCPNYNFNPKIIDLNKYGKYAINELHSVFIKKDSLYATENKEDSQLIQEESADSILNQNECTNNHFIEGLIDCNDSYFMTNILIRTSKIGFVTGTKYLYRNRPNPKPDFDKESVFNKFKLFFNPLIDANIENGSIPESLQYVFVKELKNIVDIDLDEMFTDSNDLKQFWDYFNHVFDLIDIDIIKKHSNIPRNVKTFLVYLKNNRDFNILVDKDKKQVTLRTDDYPITRMHKNRLYLDVVEIRNKELYVVGSYKSSSVYEALSVEAIKKSKKGKETFKGIFLDYPTTARRVKKFLDTNWDYSYNFHFKIPLDENEESKINFRLVYDENGEKLAINNNIKFRKFSGLNEFGNYFIKDSKIVLFRGKTFFTEPYSYGKMFKYELKSILRIFKGKKESYFKAILFRLLHLILYPFMNGKKIWIFSERPDIADADGYYLYKYINTQDMHGIKMYYAIDKTCEDYSKMRQISKNIVDLFSFKHKILFFFADKIVTPWTNKNYVNPFYYDNVDLYAGTYSSDVYFLQHGIIKDDISSRYNRWRDNIILFLTSSDYERDYIVNGGYNYDPEVVVNLGLPRHDTLKNVEGKKQILFVPTWRFYIKTEEDFLESEYYHQIDSLLNNEKLISFVKEKGYQIIFKPHPEIMKFLDLIKINNDSVVVETKESYQKLFNESSIMITDYSSVFFDFAFLKKPVIYYHKDKNHHEESYFKYETMGFGDVIKEEEPLVNKIIEYIENDCEMEEEYKNRVDDFFSFTDRKNCKRCYDWILNH